MVWYGMVWYGMVWCAMVWYGMVLYGMVWYGMNLSFCFVWSDAKYFPNHSFIVCTCVPSWVAIYAGLLAVLFFGSVWRGLLSVLKEAMLRDWLCRTGLGGGVAGQLACLVIQWSNECWTSNISIPKPLCLISKYCSLPNISQTKTMFINFNHRTNISTFRTFPFVPVPLCPSVPVSPFPCCVDTQFGSDWGLGAPRGSVW